MLYALIHGAYHGAWCWDRVLQALEERGHEAIAIDLPVEDPTAGVSHYAKVVERALDGESDEVVLVGHSLGGLTVPIVATHRPVRHVIFLAAVLPSPGRSFADQRLHEPDMEFKSVKIDNGDGTWTRSAEEAMRIYYHDCSPARRQYAVARLRRQSQAPYEEPSPLIDLPELPTTYIVCSDDRALRPDWQRRAARNQLQIEPVEIPGSHSPFLRRPAALADLLSRSASNSRPQR